MKVEGYHVLALTEDGEEKVVYATTDAQSAAKVADQLREQGCESVWITKYK